MNNQICIALFIGLGIAVVTAYPTAEFLTLDDNQIEEYGAQNGLNSFREKRQLNFNMATTSRPPISFDGTSVGGSRGQGFDINANSRFPIWSSQNGRNSFDGTAGYSQHVGGPWGNSRPDYRGGVIFTHRF